MEGETVIAGVDTHKDVHVLCLLDGLGRKIWSGSFGADPEGYDRLAEAIGDPGSCMVVGVEGTASYGAGLTRRLVELGYNVVEVLRPKRDKVRPGEGKSDPLDAERAARKAASGRGCSVPKSQDGWVEAVRQLYVARRLAVACYRQWKIGQLRYCKLPNGVTPVYPTSTTPSQPSYGSLLLSAGTSLSL